MAQSDINKNSSNLDELLQEKKLLRLLSAHELATYLNKSVRWIQIEISAGRLPKSLKLGRALVFHLPLSYQPTHQPFMSFRL